MATPHPTATAGPMAALRKRAASLRGCAAETYAVGPMLLVNSGQEGNRPAIPTAPTGTPVSAR
jgi:hypothetical protein